MSEQQVLELIREFFFDGEAELYPGACGEWACRVTCGDETFYFIAWPDGPELEPCEFTQWPPSRNDM